MRPRAPQLEFTPAPARAKVPRPTELTAALQQLLAKLALAAALFLVACIPPTPAQKATEAARELNMGARWGKMDEAMGRTSPRERPRFAKRRATWHTNIRIVETELVGLNMKDGTHATIQVDVSWMFSDDPTLRVTRLTQEWSDADGKWVMLSEKKLSGDPGLFGEKVKRAEKPKDKHFPSRVIH
jgi:hypothetical protein